MHKLSLLYIMISWAQHNGLYTYMYYSMAVWVIFWIQLHIAICRKWNFETRPIFYKFSTNGNMVQISHKFNVICMCGRHITVMWHACQKHYKHNATHWHIHWHTCMIWWVYICRDLSFPIIAHCHIKHLIIIVW